MPLTASKTYTVVETAPVAPETRYLITVTDDASNDAIQRAYGSDRAACVQSLRDFGFTVIDN